MSSEKGKPIHFWSRHRQERGRPWFALEKTRVGDLLIAKFT